MKFSLFGAGVVYLVYDVWLRDILANVPAEVWQLAGWTWAIWTGWYLLQRLTR